MAYDVTWDGTETLGVKGISFVWKRSRRRIAYLVPSAAFALVRMPLSGINYPAGNSYGLGIGYRAF